MLKQKTQDIEMGGATYRLTKMDARSGCYVAAKIATMIKPGAKLSGAGSISSALIGLNRRDFDELQTIILQRVQKLTDGLPEPILKVNGEFIDEDLAYDTATVMGLTVSCAIFNVGDFFAAAGLELQN